MCERWMIKLLTVLFRVLSLALLFATNKCTSNTCIMTSLAERSDYTVVHAASLLVNSVTYRR